MKHRLRMLVQDTRRGPRVPDDTARAGGVRGAPEAGTPRMTNARRTFFKTLGLSAASIVTLSNDAAAQARVIRLSQALSALRRGETGLEEGAGGAAP